jgi:hypothetical protein
LLFSPFSPFSAEFGETAGISPLRATRRVVAIFTKTTIFKGRMGGDAAPVIHGDEAVALR